MSDKRRATWAGLCLAASALSAAAGCELSRPEGAFTPAYPEAGPGLKEFPDASAEGDGDSTPLVDAGAIKFDNEKYKDLVGYYLARFDEHSTTVSHLGVPVGDVVVKNRVSRFFLLAIREQDGALKSVEQMCGQLHEHTCSASCNGAPTTRIFPTSAKLIRTSLPIVRDLTLSARGDLEAPAKSTYLGYAGTESDHVLPSSTSDQRVWNHGTDEAGLYTELNISVKTPPIGSQSLTCQLSLVQELNLSWKADVGSADAPVLDGVHNGSFVSSAGTMSKILAARADDKHTASDCMGDGADSDDTPGKAVVQFKKTELTSCPSVTDLDKPLPPDGAP